MTTTPAASISDNYPLFLTLEAVRTALTEAEWGTWGGLTAAPDTYGVNLDCEYAEDGEGQYAVIGFALPDDFFAEIDGGTYGALFGFRIYREDLS